MYKIILVLLTLTSSCCNLPVDALRQASSSMGSEYAEYVIADPGYDENAEGLSQEEKQIRLDQKMLRLNNLRLVKELLDELNN